MNDLSLQTIHEQEQTISALRATIAEKDGEIETLKHECADLKLQRDTLLEITWLDIPDEPHESTQKWVELFAQGWERRAVLNSVESSLSAAHAESISSALQVEAMRKALEDCERKLRFSRVENASPEIQAAQAALSAPPSETLAQVRGALERSLEALDFVAKNVPRFTYAAAKANGREAWVHDLVIPAQTAAQSALALIGGTTK